MPSAHALLSKMAWGRHAMLSKRQGGWHNQRRCSSSEFVAVAKCRKVAPILLSDAVDRTFVLQTTRSRTAGSKCFGAPPSKQPQERGAELPWSGSLKSHDDVCSQDSWKLQRRKNFLRPTACAQSPRVPARRA